MIISSKKYACETCIKGHRSSACKHTDRPLFEIKKKGRPVTQCEHCRELRKTKQVHVKCICESKADFTAQGHKQGFESAAFPNGLPEALEASVAFPNPDSDSDHGGHRCKAGDVCHCVTPRTRVRKRGDSDSGSAPGHPSSSQILARIAELRPVLPRPSGPVHTPSTGTHHGHGGRHHDTAFNPYERAYGMTHQHPAHPQSYAGTSNTTFPYNAQSFAEPWTQNVAPDGGAFPSLCGCGDDCNCPGCMHHNRSNTMPVATAYASCTNPGACSACLDCTIMSLPPAAFLPPNTALSIYDSQNDSIDEWLRQLSSTSFSDPSQPPLQQDFQMPSNFQQQTIPSQGWAMVGDTQNTMPQASFSYESSAMPNMTPFSTSNIRSGFSPQPQSQPQRGHRSRASMSSVDARSMIDPLLLDATGVLASSQFFNPNMDKARSRSPSESSSQSSHHGSDVGPINGSGTAPPYRPSGRVQGMFANSQGVRSAPQLNIRPVQGQAGCCKGPTSASLSSSPASASSSSAHRHPYAASNPDTTTNMNRSDNRYDPSSIAGLSIY